MRGSPAPAPGPAPAPAPSQPPAGTPPRAAIRVELQRGARSGAEAAANLPLPGAAQPGGIDRLFAGENDDGFGDTRFPGAVPKPEATPAPG
ncbi:hypothetical protein IX54_13125, partial [Paracoccus sanguinis]